MPIKERPPIDVAREAILELYNEKEPEESIDNLRMLQREIEDHISELQWHQEDES